MMCGTITDSAEFLINLFLSFEKLLLWMNQLGHCFKHKSSASECA